MAYDGTYITDLDISLPAPIPLTQPVPIREWDDAAREIKRCMQNSFPNIDGPVLVTQADLNKLSLTNIQLIQRSGGAMLAPLIASRDPVEDLELVTKQWVESLFVTPPTVPGSEYEYGYIDVASVPRQLLTTNTLYSITNTLSDTPTKWIVKLHCITAEYGYEVGDEIKITLPQSNDTSNNAYRGGLTCSANDTDLRIQTGARVYILDKRVEFPGVMREVTTFNWEISGKAIQIGNISLIQPCTPGSTWYDTGSTFFGNSTRATDVTFFDRTNDRLLFCSQGGNGTVYGCWSLTSNSLLWEETYNNVNNRSYCFGFSGADNGNIDRYLRADRSGTYELDIDGNTIRTLQSNTGSGIVVNGWECLGFFGYEIGTSNIAFVKGSLETGVEYFQQDLPAGYTYIGIVRQYISLPDQTYFFDLLKNTTTDVWAVCAYTPAATNPGSGANGTAGTPVDTLYSELEWTPSGAVYDGTYAWLLMYKNATTYDYDLVKIDLTGAVVDAVVLTGLSGAASADVNTNISLDPNGYIAIGLDSPTANMEVTFINTADNSIVTRSIGYDHNNSIQFDGAKCLVYTTDCYNDGGPSARILYACVNCPQQG